MAPNSAAADAARSQQKDAPESLFTIEFTTEVLTEIRQYAMKAFRSLPYGGLEIGGVLFGRVLPSGRNPKRVEVEATRPIECDHAAGPAFILSSAERVRLTQVFEQARLEEELAALAVVGFWVSHGRSELGLTSHDADLYRAFFPLPWQISLMLKPENNRPMREALFCRIDAKVVPYKRPAEPAPAPIALVPPAAPAESVKVDSSPAESSEHIPEPQAAAPPEPQYRVPEYREEIYAPALPRREFYQPQYYQDQNFQEPPFSEQALTEQAFPEQGFPEQVLPEQALPEQAFLEQALPEQALEQPAPLPLAIPEVINQQPVVAEPLAAKPPTAAELPRFATDIYLPTPPVEPRSTEPSAPKTWAKDLYRPAGRSRALLQATPVAEPVTEPLAEPVPEPLAEPVAEIEAAEDFADNLPRLRSYWEREPEPAPELAPVAASFPPPSYSLGWTAPDPSVAAEEPAPVEPVAVLENAAVLESQEPDPQVAEQAVTAPAAPAATEEPAPVVQPQPAVVEAEAIPAPGFTKARAVTSEAYVAPKPELKEQPRPPVPDAAEVGDELARLLVSIRAAAADTRNVRGKDEAGEERVRSTRHSKHSFGIVTVALLMLAGLLIGGVLGFWFFGNHQPVAAKAPGPGLGLEMFNTGKEILIHWDANSPMVLNARTAELRIHDSGMVQTLLLDLSSLSKGYYRYQPTSSDVHTTLIVVENDGRNEQSIASRFSE